MQPNMGIVAYPSMHSRVMVLSAASGDGHVRAADAIVSALRARDIAARHVEALQHTGPLLRWLYAEYYLQTVDRRPWLLGFAYDSMDDAGRFEISRLCFDLIQTRRLARLLTNASPGVILCTHFLPAEIAVHLRRKRHLEAQIGVIVTDFDFHPLWLYRGVDWYFVAGPEARDRLVQFGVAPETIHMTGIPVDRAFAICEQQADARMHLGLQIDRATVLVSAGGFGMGPVEALVGTLQRVSHPLQIVMVCGKNEALQKRLGSLPPAAHPLTVVGYTDEMHTWMAAADLLVGKAGGLTCAEAMVRGLVPIIVNAIPGPEERNAAILARRGAAVWCRATDALAGEIDALLCNPGRLRSMRQAVAAIAAPSAAERIAAIVAEGRSSQAISSRPVS
jgi:processive 1,2-diacylglycerol beta-glucosyltransferase